MDKRFIRSVDFGGDDIEGNVIRAFAAFCMPPTQMSRVKVLCGLKENVAQRSYDPLRNSTCSRSSLSDAEIECEGFVAVEAGVELFPVHEEAAIVDRDLVAVARFLPLRTHHALGDVHLGRKGINCGCPLLRATARGLTWRCGRDPGRCGDATAAETNKTDKTTTDLPISLA